MSLGALHRHRRHRAAVHGGGLTALEFLVAFLQAFVFAILTCVYLNVALHTHH